MLAGARHVRGKMISQLLRFIAAATLFCTLVAAQGNLAAERRLTCYNVAWPEGGPGPSTATATSFPVTADTNTCVRYQFTCTEGDSSCSDIPAGTTKWAYTIVPAASCDVMKSSAMNYFNVFCCADDLCNKPDPKLDPDTQAVDSPVIIIGNPPQLPSSPTTGASQISSYGSAPSSISGPSPATPQTSPSPATPSPSLSQSGPNASPAPFPNDGTSVTATKASNGSGSSAINAQIQGAAVLDGSGNRSSAAGHSSGCLLFLLGSMAIAGLLL